MPKTKEEFVNSCFELLSLMHERNMTNEEAIQARIQGENIFICESIGKFICYDDIFKDKLYYLTDKLLDLNKNREVISLTALWKKIQEFLEKCFFIKKDERHVHINEFYDDLVIGLKQNLREYAVIFFIENLSFKSDTFIGNIKFIQYSHENCISLIKIYSPETSAPETYLPISSRATKLSHHKEFIKSIGVVEVTCIDYDKAIEKANEKIEEALNVIRLFKKDSCFGILGGYNNSSFHDVVAIDLGDKIINSSFGWEGKPFGCKFDTDELTDYGKKVFENICKILKTKDGKTDKKTMENKLLTAINIFGDIQKTREQKYNISKIFTALEALLVFDGEFKGESIAERVVLINYKDRRDRINRHKVIRDMYRRRNGLIHEGNTDFKILDYRILLSELQLCIMNIAKYIDDYPMKEDWKNIFQKAKESIFETKLIFQ